MLQQVLASHVVQVTPGYRYTVMASQAADTGARPAAQRVSTAPQAEPTFSGELGGVLGRD